MKEIKSGKLRKQVQIGQLEENVLRQSNVSIKCLKKRKTNTKYVFSFERMNSNFNRKLFKYFLNQNIYIIKIKIIYLPYFKNKIEFIFNIFLI